MITGILLLYIGFKLQLPTLYFIGCWTVIIGKAINFTLITYKKGKDAE